MVTTPLYGSLRGMLNRASAVPLQVASASLDAQMRPTRHLPDAAPAVSAVPVAPTPPTEAASSDTRPVTAIPVSVDQRALVEALGDSFIRLVVDALAQELDRIGREGSVRAD